jgi:hypothetical protein
MKLCALVPGHDFFMPLEKRAWLQKFLNGRCRMKTGYRVMLLIVVAVMVVIGVKYCADTNAAATTSTIDVATLQLPARVNVTSCQPIWLGIFGGFNIDLDVVGIGKGIYHFPHLPILQIGNGRYNFDCGHSFPPFNATLTREDGGYLLTVVK